VARPACSISNFLVFRLVTAGVVSVSNRPSGAPSCITAPPVKGVLEALNASRKGFFEETCQVFEFLIKT
jgi:hypothetical protein